MKAITRRSFLKNTGAATGAIALGTALQGGWLSCSKAQALGYFESEFGISDSLCQKALAKALSKGGDFGELFFEHTISNWLMLEDGKVNRAYSDVSLGVGIRTVKDDQVGYGFTQELTEESILAAAATAATIANANSNKPAGEFVNLKMNNYYPLKNLLTSVALESKLPLVQTTNDKCFELSPLIIKVSAGFHDQQKRILVVTSDGTKAEDLLPRNYLYASVVAEKDGKRERAGWNLGGRKDFSFYTTAVVDEVAKAAVDRVLVLFDAVQPPAGEMPVVLGPGVTAILLHEAIGHGMEADFNRKEQSTYCTMIGKKVAEPFVTIIDDATNPKLPGSLNVDDEGTPGQKTVLVDNGILTSYMHDKISALHYKLEPTGNGRRQSYQHYIQPRMRNTYMLPGPAKPGDVIKSVKNGIYVQDVSNGQVNIGAGDFAFFVSQGKKIEDGKLTAPIKDINIMGNGPKMLTNITMLADDLEMSRGGGGACGKGGQRVPVGFGQPTCLVKSMTVGGKKA
ncbi:twin-arginine translocation signal domain-containing protein [candidate division KSB1 bacterium]|nr:twin-arginine translocation signal domain-containing protein [candidate division KSB1 bacterium]MBL7095053.1 twin-arginine translocation signal domain-containing protein [candidate division KSB1 bacterium]